MPRSKVVEILMRRDGISEEEALAEIEECLEELEMGNDYALEDVLGLEDDYLLDIIWQQVKLVYLLHFLWYYIIVKDKEGKIMWRYEVLYIDNGITKGKGFGYKDKFDRFVTKLMKNPTRYTYVKTFNADIPGGGNEVLRDMRG